jgi:hypothetical protein
MPADAPSATILVAHEIELRFIEWGRPTLIAREYAIRDRGTIYRHAHAAGLFAIRLRNFMCLYQNTIEQAQQTKISRHTIMSGPLCLPRASAGLSTPKLRRRRHSSALPADISRGKRGSQTSVAFDSEAVLGESEHSGWPCVQLGSLECRGWRGEHYVGRARMKAYEGRSGQRRCTWGRFGMICGTRFAR